DGLLNEDCQPVRLCAFLLQPIGGIGEDLVDRFSLNFELLRSNDDRRLALELALESFEFPVQVCQGCLSESTDFGICQSEDFCHLLRSVRFYGLLLGFGPLDHTCPQGFNTCLRTHSANRIMTETMKPKMTKVSGRASIMITVPLDSGR